MKYVRITREMIEGCLDDELFEMYGEFVYNQRENKTLPAGEIIKKCLPDVYEQYFVDYCEREGIEIIFDMKTGRVIKYLEPQEDEEE